MLEMGYSEVASEGSREARTVVRWTSFLRDVLICSLGAYGGPESHMSVFLTQLVGKRGYLTETELVEFIGLTSMLPGPTSTQTIVSIGYRIGGPRLALLTMLVWSLPVLIVMGSLSFLYDFLAAREISHNVLRFVGPMAVGFILVAAVRIGRKVVVDIPTALLTAAAAVGAYLIRAPWIFPVLLIAGGATSIIVDREAGMWNRVRIRPPWRYLTAFVVIAAASGIAATLTDLLPVRIFESLYRYGYLVFGGGQVIVPMMHTELVEVARYMTNDEFLTGYGLVQGLPGPMFSFAAYAGGLSARGAGTFEQILGAVAGGVGIFLPGLLLIFFVYPIWEDLKQIRAVRIALKGICAVAGGLLAIAAIILLQATGFTAGNLAAIAASVVLLAVAKVPPPLIVAAALAAGFVV